MAWDIAQFRIGIYSADTDMSAKSNTFTPVWIGVPSNISGHNGAALVAKGSLTYPCLGILQNNPIQNEVGLVVVSGISKFRAGGTITVGAPLTWNAGGTALIVATTGTFAIGMALEACASGEVSECLLVPRGLIP